MALTIEQLFTPKTRDEVLEEMLVIADALSFPARSWQPGSIARTILVIVAQVVSNLTILRVEFARSGFLDWARGGWLTVLAAYIYGVDRQLATFADGFITLTNVGDQSHDWEPGELHFAHAITGRTYTVQDGAGGTYGPALAPGESRTYAILADEAGSASTAAPGAITIMVTPLPGVTASNGLALVGFDDELDEPLRARCREKLGSLSPNGAADAFSFIVKSDSPRFDPQPAQRITRTKTYLGSDNEVHTLVANAGGDASADVPLLQARVDRWTSPIPFTSIVESAYSITIDVVGTMFVKGTTMTEAEINAKLASAFTTFFSGFPIGGYDTTGAGEEGMGYLDTDAIKAIAFQIVPGIVSIDFSLPSAADVPIYSNAVPVLGDCTFAVTVLP